LYASKTHSRELDKMLWTPTCNKGFEVKRYYNSLFPGEPYLFPCKSIWKVKAPPHITFLTWTTAWVKILTIDYLRR
jgi:hypothetical protein